MKLNECLNDDERVVKFFTTKSPVFNTGAILSEMIVPKDVDISRLDLGACLENTLHRLLDNGAMDDEIEEITGMVLADDDEEDTYIDLGYVLPGHLMQIVEE